PVTSDHDVFDLSTPGGSRPSPTSYDTAVSALKDGDMGVGHGAHMYWKPVTQADQAMFESIAANHLSGQEPLV
ncbi:hypothetical protein NGM37_25740, partial [Streptomyces sp. TRM76130]|nr:hypothetical protein [Streptomyces sp. TRM76130]